jgi:RimJ/RimL family protein N-acetyltransferase
MFKILIRPLVEEDAQISYIWRNDPDIWKYTGNKPNIQVTEEIEKKWILEKLEEKDSVRFAIIVDNEYVGNIQLTNIKEYDTAEYHIFIGNKNYWNKGVAYLATAQIILYSKEILFLKTIYLTVNTKNIAAIKVYEKLGFIISAKDEDTFLMVLPLGQSHKPIVSVFMMAYNHEKYIKEAIDGVLMQKTNFDFDIVIGEDCSRDNTRQIILGYQEKYPGKFKLLLHKKNIGAMANQNAVFASCTGKYIALCEGDDYWTDPLKLQKQVDFLENNAQFSAQAHNSKYVGLKEGLFSKLPSQIYNTSSLIDNRKFHTNSILFKNTEEIKNLISKQRNILSGDRFLYIAISCFGNIYYSDEVMSVYRRNDGSISNKVTYLDLEKDFNMIPILKPYLKNKELLKLKSFLHFFVYTNGKKGIPSLIALKHYFSFLILSFSYFPKNLGNIKWGTIFLFRRLKK